MVGTFVYIKGRFIRAQRQALPADRAHPLDAHLGRHVVMRIFGEEIVIQPLFTGGDEVRLPAAAVWSTSELPGKLSPL